MKTLTIPNSGRTAASELKYQEAKEKGLTIPLQDEPALINYKHWKLIANRFPYDAIYSVHDMLIPRRIFADEKDMTIEEWIELVQIKQQLANKYETYLENTDMLRSITDLYHLHAVVQLKRDEKGWE